MYVFVIGLNSTPLMPCKPRKARKLLEEGKAHVYCKRPFTIQLDYKTGSTTQDVTVGVDTGSQHIGIAVVSNDKVLHQTEITLRDSMEKRTLLETRKTYRRGRRHRNTRYRKPKFRFHTKRVYVETPVQRKSTKHMTHWKKIKTSTQSNHPEGWLPPSIQSKVDHHVRWIQRFLDVLPAQTQLNLEVGRFDVARMKNPDIHNELYQQGPLYDYENVRAYVFDRDGYRCQVCKQKLGSKRKDGTTVKGKIHHIQYRSKGATNNPDELITVCEDCHTPEAHKKGGTLYTTMLQAQPRKRAYRDATLMNIMRTRLWSAFPDAWFTYGNITKVDREQMHLPKSHANDAIAIATRGHHATITEPVVYYKQVRKKKRSLHEATPRKGRTAPNRTAKRNCKNTKQAGTYKLYDEVVYNGEKGWITGFTGSAAYIQDKNGHYITVLGKSYKQVSLKELTRVKHNNNWISYVG